MGALSEGLLERLVPGAQDAAPRRERLTATGPGAVPEPEICERCRQALALLGEGAFDEEAAAEVLRAAELPVALAACEEDKRPALALLDFIAEPCRETAGELRKELKRLERRLERRIARRVLEDGNPLDLLERRLGLGAAEIARIMRVKEATVRRWRRGPLYGWSRDEILNLALACEWLERAGLGDQEKRRWLSQPQEGLGGSSPLEHLLAVGKEASGLVEICARELYELRRERGRA